MRRRLLLPAVIALALMLSGCGDGERDGGTIEFFGPYRGVEADQFAAMIEPFEQESGIEVRYVGSGDFVSELRERALGAKDPPDLAAIPEPALIRELADAGALEQPSARTRAQVSANFPAEVSRFGRLGSRQYGVPLRLAIKSLVWFSPEIFSANGWEVPLSLDELEALSAEIAAGDGPDPWCMTMSAGSSTGWVATDWTEEIVLRRAGIETYRKWARGKLPFTDPAIRSAFREFEQLVLAQGRLAGGLRSVFEQEPFAGVSGIFGAEPACAMFRQSEITVGFMPEGTEIGPDGDIDFFPLPGVDPAEPAPLLLAGDSVVQFSREPAVDALMEYLANETSGESWAGSGNFISPKRTIPVDAYPDSHQRDLIGLALDWRNRELAFDASDQMPAEVGSGLLWEQISDWVGGTTSYRELAEAVNQGLGLD